MKKYETPRLDAILLEEGWWCPNEASLYVKKNDDEKWKYRVIFTFEGWEELERWMGVLGDDVDVVKMVTSNLEKHCSTYVTDTMIVSGILMLTADFYLHRLDWPMHEKAVNIYNKFTGRKYSA